MTHILYAIGCARSDQDDAADHTALAVLTVTHDDDCFVYTLSAKTWQPDGTVEGDNASAFICWLTQQLDEPAAIIGWNLCDLLFTLEQACRDADAEDTLALMNRLGECAALGLTDLANRPEPRTRLEDTIKRHGLSASTKSLDDHAEVRDLALSRAVASWLIWGEGEGFEDKALTAAIDGLHDWRGEDRDD